MEPLDSDLEYAAEERPAKPGSKMSALFLFPVIGFIILLVFIGAAIFQWDLSDLISPFMGLLMILFFALIAMLFWALSPKEGRA